MFAARTDTILLTAAAGAFAVSVGAGLMSPGLFWLAIAGSIAAGIGFIVFRHTTAFCVAWLLVAGMTLEMTFHDLAGDETFQQVIAVVKGMEIVLACLCAARFGARLDIFNPVWAYLAILAAGLVHGLYPGLTAADSVRSCIGSAAPFAFCFCRLPRRWAGAIIRATKWCAIVAVGACLPLAAAGIRPLFVDSGGARLAGLGHPAFLAGVCLPAIYACLVCLYRHGRRGDLALLTVNGLILTLTGARAPMAYAVAVTGLALVSIPSRRFTARARLLLILSVASVLPLLVLFAGDLSDIRLFNIISHEAGNLSGRGLLWPAFEDAAAQSPWFGWGIGAGNVVIPPEGQIAKTLHTWAAHNEYLRMEVEGGLIGRALLIALFAVWVFVHTRGLPRAEARIMRLVFIAFACHAYTDNVLISTPACVLFAFATAVFVREPDETARLILPDSTGKA
jgi:O-antigen ligase